MNYIQKYWHYMLLITAIFYSIITKSDMFNISVLCSGVLCVALVAKGNIWNYIIGMYNTIAYAYIAFTEHLYGEFGLYVLFFIPTNIIGFIMWRKHTVSNTVTSKELETKNRMLLLLCVITLTISLAIVLKQIPNQNNPYMDAYITITSITATLLMMKRYSEQWILYILLNAVSIALWTIRYMKGSDVALSMIGMWSIFFINALFGWYMWHKKLKDNKQNESRINIG